MSPKELLYIQDTLGHGEQLKTLCNEYAGKIQDPQLKSFVQNLGTQTESIFNNFINLL